MRNYVIGTSDHTGRHLNIVQADSVQAALEMCGVLDPGRIPRKDMATHADVDYIYVEEPTGAVDKCENEHVIPYPEIRTVGDLKAIIAGLPDTYAVTRGSDSVGVPTGNGEHEHHDYEIVPDVSRITTMHVNPDRRELYIGVDINLNKLR